MTHNFASIEGIELLSAQAMANIEAAKSEDSSTCTSCTKSKKTAKTEIVIEGEIS